MGEAAVTAHAGDQVIMLTGRGAEANRLVLTGVVIHNSTDATVRVGKALGYSIILPSDATTPVPVTGPDGKSWDSATFYDLTLAILSGEYAEVMTSDDLIARFPESRSSDG